MLNVFKPRLASINRVIAVLVLGEFLLIGSSVAIDQLALRAVLAATAGALGFALPFYHLLVHQADHAQEARNLWGLAGVMVDGRSWPAPGRWALGADALGFLEGEITRRQLHTIVELGPGTSSVVLGRRFGSTVDMYGLEHDPVYAERVREQLDRHELRDYSLIEAPLAQDNWYHRSALLALPPMIDLLLVDGPPNWAGKGYRSPAWRELGPRMRPGGLILVDDTRRPDERRMVSEWVAGGGLNVIFDAGDFIALEIVS